MFLFLKHRIFSEIFLNLKINRYISVYATQTAEGEDNRSCLILEGGLKYEEWSMVYK